MTTTLRERIRAILDDPFPFVDLNERERLALSLAVRGQPVSQIAGATKRPNRTAYRILEGALAKLAFHYHWQVTRTDLPGLVLDRIIEELER
ncbi:MAG TPA: hypothetical protein VJK02_21190 [Anaerolineales bacterium]|nr:hypothetical protein [Anaerolineales bacterium]